MLHITWHAIGPIGATLLGALAVGLSWSGLTTLERSLGVVAVVGLLILVTMAML